MNEEEEFEFRRRAEQEAAAPAVPTKPPGATAMDRLQAVGTSVPRLAAGLAGIPMDTALNIGDMAKAGAGYLQSKITGNAPSEIFDPTDRSSIPFTSQSNTQFLDEHGLPSEVARPDDDASRYLAAGATGLLGGAVGGGGLPNLARQAVAGLASGVAGQGASDAGLDPGLSAILATAVGAGAGAARVPGKGAPRATPEIANTPVKEARAGGYKIPPSSVDSAPIGKALEAIAGSPRVAKSFTKANERVTTGLAKEEIGADKNSRLNPEYYTKLREPHNAAYEAVGTELGDVTADRALRHAVSQVGKSRGSNIQPNQEVAQLRDAYSNLENASASDVIREVRSLRDKASSNSKVAYGAPNRTESHELGKAQQEMADALDGWIERSANVQGKPQVATQYKAARVALAKIGTAERATRGGEVQAQKLTKQLEKKAPLSGRLKLAAEAGGNFPEVTGAAPAGVEVTVPPSTLFGTVKNAGQALLAPTIQRFLKSDLYQNSLGRQAETLGPTSSVGRYFQSSGPDFPPRVPSTPAPITNGGALARDLDLELAPEPHGDVPFTSSRAPQQSVADTLAGALELAQDAPLQRSLPEALDVGDLSLDAWDAPQAASAPFPYTRQNQADFTPEPAIGPYAKVGTTPTLGSELGLVDEPLPGRGFSPTENTDLATELRLMDEPLPSAPKSPPNLGPAGDLGLEGPTPHPGVKHSPSELAEATWKEATPEEKSRLKPITEEMDLEPKKLDKIPPATAASQSKVTIQPSDRPGYFKVQVEGKSKPIAEVKGREAAQELVDGLDVSDKPADVKTPTKVTAKIDAKTGEHTIESPNGGLVLRPQGKYLRIQYAQVKEGKRGKGEGAALYKKGIESAESAGKIAASDVKVSAAAARVYDVLERDGFEVTRNPVTIDEATGELTSKDPKVPAFVVRSKRSDLRATG